MRPDEYTRYDAVGLRDLLASRAVSAEEVETAARELLDAVDPEINGLALPPFEPALEYAADGPLAGVPFLIKDFGPIARGVPFFCGSRAVRGIVAQRDSPLMTRIRKAGLVTLGLTTSPELGASFATEPLRSGPTRNPWDLGRGVGGSSGGSAALVAAGAVPIAHGRDGAGSIRVPASCCGLVGLKPSRGRTPAGPDTADVVLALNCDGPLTRSVRDAAHFLDAIGGAGSGDKFAAAPPQHPYAAELDRALGRLRVGVSTRDWSGAAVDPEVSAATSRAGLLLERLGHHVADAAPTVDSGAVLQIMHAGLVSMAEPFLTAPRRPAPGDLEAVTRSILGDAEAATALDLIAALRAQAHVTHAVAAFFRDHELLVTPTLARLPARHGTLRYDDPRQSAAGWLASMFEYGPFTAVFNIAGLPAISLPLARAESGLPIGVQLVAASGREDLLLRVAAQLEAAAPWPTTAEPAGAGTMPGSGAARRRV